jgi:hypothetical protein
VAFVARPRCTLKTRITHIPRQNSSLRNSRIRFSPSRGRSRPSIASLLRSGWLPAGHRVSSILHRSAEVVRIPLSRWVLSLLDTIAALAAGSPPAASFFTRRFCVPVSAPNGAWIDACVVSRWARPAGTPGARESSGSLLSKCYSPRSKLCIVMALEPAGGHCIAMSRPARAGRPRHRAAHR